MISEWWLARQIKQAELKFSYCPDAAVPEIPLVEDVFFALRLNQEPMNYCFCVANHQVYINNVHLVCAVVGSELCAMTPYDESLARRLIAQTIVDLCPAEAKCLFNMAYTQACELAGQPVISATTADELRQGCDCPRCLVDPNADQDSAYA